MSGFHKPLSCKRFHNGLFLNPLETKVYLKVGNVREISLPGVGAGNYWESPDFWQESKLGQFMSVEKPGKKNATWGIIKERNKK